VSGGTFSSREALDETYVPFFGAFGAARNDVIAARWSANPLGMLWPEMDAAFVRPRGAPTVAVRPVAIIAGSCGMGERAIPARRSPARRCFPTTLRIEDDVVRGVRHAADLRLLALGAAWHNRFAVALFTRNTAYDMLALAQRYASSRVRAKRRSSSSISSSLITSGGHQQTASRSEQTTTTWIVPSDLGALTGPQTDLAAAPTGAVAIQPAPPSP